MLLERLPPDERCDQLDLLCAAFDADEIASEGLLIADRGGRLVGVVLSQLHPGRAAQVWPPRLVTGEPASTGAGLLSAAADWLQQQDVRVAQALLPPGDPPPASTWTAAGFGQLGELLYLVAEEGCFPTRPPQSPLQFEPYTPAAHGRLLRVVEATYQETLDCPQLNGVRDTEGVVAGYRATGSFEASRWLIVRHGGEDVGCLLLADHPPHENIELVYMGVVTSSRGQGWGIEIARQAQWLTRQAGRPRLVLAVDAANQPGIRMYAAVGFEAWDTRTAYLRVFQHETE